jgi:hypothetical protein
MATENEFKDYLQIRSWAGMFSKSEGQPSFPKICAIGMKCQDKGEGRYSKYPWA